MKFTLILSTLLVVIAACFAQNSPTQATWVQWGQKAQLLRTFSSGSPVYGVVAVANLIHVIRENGTGLQVYNYNGGLYNELLSIQLPGSGGYFDMAYLSNSNRIVLLNWFQSNKVFVLNLNPPYNLTTWNFTDMFTSAALSVTQPDQNIVVTDATSQLVKVYNPSGKLLRTIKLQMSRMPRHAIRLPNNLYAVSTGYEKIESHLVCKFNVLGFVVGRCFGGKPGNSTRQLNVPARMVNLKDGNVLLADMKNSRVLKLNSDLTDAQVVLDASDGINQPYRLEVDENAGLLYVADNILDPKTSYAVSGRVLVFRY